MQPDLDNNRNPWHAKERKLKQNTKQRIICKNPDEPWTQRTTIARHARTTTADSHKIEKTPVHDDFSPYSHGAVQRTKLSSGAEKSPSRKRDRNKIKTTFSNSAATETKNHTPANNKKRLYKADNIRHTLPKKQSNPMPTPTIVLSLVSLSLVILEF